MNKLIALFAVCVLSNSTVSALSLWPFASEAEQKKCVHIYYDKSENPEYKIGKVYAVYLQNLMGHFPEFQQIISPVEYYKKNDLEKCQANIYIGSYFQNKIPKDFLADFKVTKTNFAWLGYNIWQIDEEWLKNNLEHSYSHITNLDRNNLDKNQQPSFFRFFTYKGETFEKFGKFVGKDKVFHAGFEMIALVPSVPPEQMSVHVLSEGIHSVSGERRPYILQKNNYFYVADVPFSYVHESDRYLIFADILFDILKAPPRHTEKLALVRIEDVHALSDLPELYKMAKVFEEEKVPLNISLIPVFFDPLFQEDRGENQEFLPMTRVPQFMRFIEHIKKQDTQFIWHGVTHQHARAANPHTGMSSSDFEFWDAINNKPLPEDSINYVLDRLDFGWSYLKEANIQPVAWLTPHYQASALDYVIFSKVFTWNVGRVIYYESQIDGLSESTTDISYRLDTQNSTQRRDALKNLKVTTEGNWNGQLYPYEIYGDVYGQRLFPEILGNPQPFESAHVIYPRTLDEILSDAKRNLVLRDTWASMFFHPYLLTGWRGDGIGEYPGDVRPLRKLLRGLKDLGYTFVNTKKFVEENQQMRPTPIFIKQGDN